MAANVVNKSTKLTRGFPAQLGTITAANDVVTFTLSEPTRDHQGVLVIQVRNGPVAGVYKLEASIDGAVSWGDIATLSTTTTADFGDQAASVLNTYTVSGFGSGALFRFGRTDATGGGGIVFALVG